MRVDIRPAVLVRICAYASLVLWLAAGADIFVTTLPHLIAALPLVMLLGGGVFCWRIASVRTRSDGQALIVRNVYRTRRIPAGDITELRTGRSPLNPFGRTVLIVTANDMVAVDADLIGKLRAGAEHDRAALEAWLSTLGSSRTPP